MNGTSTLTRERTGLNRGFRSGSAPTPTPPTKPPSSGANGNNYYIRRPTVIFNDERGGPSEKVNGAQARVNNKFVRDDHLHSFMIDTLYWIYLVFNYTSDISCR